MLTITINDTATVFTVNHPELTGSSTGIVLRMGLGCTGTLSSFSILPTAVVSNQFTFSLAQAYPTNTPVRFADGIYTFELQFDYTDSPDQVNKDASACVFVDYNLKCKIDTLDAEKMTIYKLLTSGNLCDTCSCTKLCELFSFLTGITSSSNDQPCQCN